MNDSSIVSEISRIQIYVLHKSEPYKIVIQLKIKLEIALLSKSILSFALMKIKQ